MEKTKNKIRISIICTLLILILIPLISSADVNFTTVNETFYNFSVAYNSEGVYNNGSSLIIGNINGSIDDLMIWDRNLSDNEINLLYRGSLTKFNSSYYNYQTTQSSGQVCYTDGSIQYCTGQQVPHSTSGTMKYLTDENGSTKWEFDDNIEPKVANSKSIGSSLLRWLKGWFVDIDASGNILANGTINATTDLCIQGGVCLSSVAAGGSANWDANYSVFLTHITWAEAMNGTLAQYQFGSNNFNGSGNFATTGNINITGWSYFLGNLSITHKTTTKSLLVTNNTYLDGTVMIKNTKGDNVTLNNFVEHTQELMANTLLDKSRSQLSCVGGELNFTLFAVYGCVQFNFNGTLYPKSGDPCVPNATVTLTCGTNVTPVTNYIYFELVGDVPTIKTSAAYPTGEHIDVGTFVVGNCSGTQYNIYSYSRNRYEVDTFVQRSLERWEEMGTLYVSGMGQWANTTFINITTGDFFNGIFEMNTVNTVNLYDGFYFINSTGHFVQATRLANLTQYADGTAFTGNNERVNIVWGIVPTNTTGGVGPTKARLVAILPNYPGAGNTYQSLSSAIQDNFGTANFFPPNTEVKAVFTPVARTILRPNTDVFEVIVGTSYFQDVRGRVTAGGSAPALVDTSGFLTIDGSRPLTADWNQGAFNLTNTDSWFLGKINWSNVQGITNYLLISQWNATNESYMTGANFTLQNTSMKNYVIDYVAIQNTSMNNYIGVQNGSLVNYIAVVNTSMNNYVIDYVGIQNTSLVNYIKVQNDSMINYIAVVNTSMNNYVVWTNTTLYQILNNGSYFNIPWNSTNESYALFNDLNNGTYVTNLVLNNGTYLNTDTFVANYSAFLTHITWAQVQNGTMVKSSELNNGTYVTNLVLNNGTYLNTFVANYSAFLTKITWAEVMNGTLAKSSELNNGTYFLTSQWNATNTSYLTAETLWNANYTTFLTHITWATVMNGTLATTAYVDAQNTSLVNYIKVQNDSLVNYIAVQNGSLVNYITIQNSSLVNYIKVQNDSLLNYDIYQDNLMNNSMKNYVIDTNNTLATWVTAQNTSQTNALATKLALAGGTMTGNLNTADNVNLTFNSGNQIWSNTTCLNFKGSTVNMWIC